jgi:2-dehydropantoate 2-reductase
MMNEPAIVERHSGPARSWFAVGGIEPSAHARADEVATLLRHSGSVEVVEDIRAAKWMKLVSNATTLVPTAILGLPIAAAAAIPEMRDLMLRSGREALLAGSAIGHPVLPIFGLTAETMEESDDLVGMLLDTLLRGFTLEQTTTTILHDWTKGRHSEVDDINGLVVAELTQRGGEAPANAAVVSPDRANLAQLLELAG